LHAFREIESTIEFARIPVPERNPTTLMGDEPGDLLARGPEKTAHIQLGIQRIGDLAQNLGAPYATREVDVTRDSIKDTAELRGDIVREYEVIGRKVADVRRARERKGATPMCVAERNRELWVMRADNVRVRCDQDFCAGQE
jgi:hypothetical protein